MDPDEVVTSLTSKQRDRRDRVVHTAMALAIDGGYDAVHMREVSARSGVALGTIYRYFPSKDHLLISVMSTWTDQLSTQLDQRPARGSTPSSRVTDVLHRACHSLERQPLLAAAVIRAMSSTEADVSRASREVGRNLRGNIEPLLAEFDADTRDAVIEIINNVWLSTLIGWSSGRLLFSQVSQQLATTVRMLLDADVRLPVDPPWTDLGLAPDQSRCGGDGPPLTDSATTKGVCSCARCNSSDPV